VSGVIDDDMLKALARFTGPVTQCPAGKASDGEMIEEVNDGIKQLAEPPTQWVWYTLPSDAEEAA
jgi:hypothetical protein